ncbi:TIM44 subunit of mitochondria import inner membrane translocase [Astrocystis sublimbata]|nr:TIM44 subunit of mitochondria import inner membrane translocase [Astrocystis sublimbata]
MSSLRHAARSTTPASVSRASSRAVHSYGRCPAYRRLISSTQRPQFSARSDSILYTSARIPTAPATAPLTLLRSPFLPDTVAAIQSRAIHTSPRHLQQQSTQPSKTPKPESKPETKPEPKPEAKPEQSASGVESEATPESEEQKKAEDGDKAGEESQEGKKEDKKEDLPPPPPHGDKTPWQVFMETMQSEFKASKEWNESTKQLSDSAHQFTESESVRRARQAYESTTGAVSSTAGKVLKSSAGAVGKGAAWTWDTSVMKGVRKGANFTGEALDKATKPIRDTDAYKSVKDVIDDGSSSRYGGWVEKEERRKARELRQKRAAAIHGNVEEAVEDPNAGTNVTVHKDAAWKEAWREFRDKNPFVQGVYGMKDVYQESENPLISTARSITDRVARFFAENETAIVIKKVRAMDPNFQLEPFQQELRDYILPEVLDAYVKGDTETLKLWLSAAQFSVYEALTKQYLQAGMKSDGRILDIRHVDILKARMLEPGEIPVFIITCRTQEVHVYRNAKTSELAAGMEDKVQLVTYVIGITRTPEDVNNPETRGWRLIEMQKSGRDYI